MHPLSSGVHIESAVSSFAIGYLPQKFAAGKIYRPVTVKKQTDKYWIFGGKEQFDSLDVTRAANGGYNRIQSKLSNSNFACFEYGLEHPIDNSAIANADDPIKPKEYAAKIIKQNLLIAQERRLALEILTTNSPTTTSTFSGTSQWSHTSSDPIAQIQTDRQAIKDLGGPEPNKLAITPGALRAAKSHALIKELVKYGGNSSVPGLVKNSSLAEIFEVDEIIVLDAVYNSAKQGQTPVLTSIWGDCYMLYAYSPDEEGDSLEKPSWGFLPTWAGDDTAGGEFIAESYPQPQINSTVMRLRHFTDELTTGKDFAVLRKDIIA